MLVQARRWLLLEPAPTTAYLVALAGSAVAALMIRLLPLLGGPALTRRVSLYLLPILYVGGRWGIGPALVGAFATLSLHELFVIAADGNPRPDPSEWIELGILCLVAVVTGALAASARREARRARESELRATFLASISHDLRTPLTAVKATLASLSQVADPVEPSRRRLLADAEAEIDRLTQLVDNTLALARLRSGRAPVREWNAVGELLFAAVDRCAALLGDRSVEVEAPDTLPLVRIDAGLLDRAVVNLLENAARHTPAGTPVRLRAAVAGGELRVEVEDDGPGLSPIDRERVVRGFERASATSPRGVGLGLPIARAAAEAHGGRLWLEAGRHGGLRVVMLFAGVGDA